MPQGWLLPAHKPAHLKCGVLKVKSSAMPVVFTRESVTHVLLRKGYQ